jgi:CheY-like chemotaxis protein
MNESPSSGTTILVIDDDDVTRASIAALLYPYFTIVGAPDGIAALDLLNQGFDPSLILLDMIVPGLDGWQFLARRRKEPALAAIPLVVMTGIGIASDEWARSLGALGLLRKPFDMDALLAAVRQAIPPEAACISPGPVPDFLNQEATPDRTGGGLFSFGGAGTGMSLHTDPPKTVLVIEDDEVARIGLSALLRAHGYRVLLAPSSDQAMAHLQTGSPPDLILLDMIQPGQRDGWQFLGQRQKGLLPPTVPVVIMTGLGAATSQWAQALGAVDLLRKPIPVEGLLEVVQRHTSDKSLSQVD